LREPLFLRSCAFSVGSARPVASLLEEGVLSPESYEDCVDRGITAYCVKNGSVAAMCADAISQATSKAGLLPEQIDCVVVAHATPCCSVNPDVVSELYPGVPQVSLRAQDCAVFSAGIEAAAEQIAAGAATNILLLLTGHVPAGTSRYNPQLGTIFGDGAAACIVSSKRGELAVIAVESALWASAPRADPAQPTGEEMLEDFQRLRNLLRRSYEHAATSPADVAAIFGTHGSQIYLELMAEAAGVPYERVYAAAMRQYGHVFACDNLIALTHFLRDPQFPLTGVLCLVGWSPRAAGVVLLKGAQLV
jgi:3-oxoacyl-[acyl-carrier-protein] synthase III